jgi:hypothetical protein
VAPPQQQAAPPPQPAQPAPLQQQPSQPLTPQQSSILQACTDLCSLLQPYLTADELRQAAVIPGAIEVLSVRAPPGPGSQAAPLLRRRPTRHSHARSHLARSPPPLQQKFCTGLIPGPVEARLLSLAESFARHDYRAAERATATLASSDWSTTKDFIRPIKLLAALGLTKSSQ